MNLSSQTLENIEIRILNSVQSIKSRSGEEASNRPLRQFAHQICAFSPIPAANSIAKGAGSADHS
jgi:hypothetical protein